MKYKAMPGSIIITIKEKTNISKHQNSSLLIVERTNTAGIEVATVVSVGDERDDIKIGTKILFPTETGLKIDANTFVLRYEDICAIVNE